MDVERLPSGKFETNELVLELTIIAYNSHGFYREDPASLF